mgnify:CR=1 FL=1
MINNDNTTRRSLDQEITAQALEQIAADPSFASKLSTIVFEPDWHKGVVGIVASRLIETHFRPTIVLTESNGVLTGSARCMAPLHLYELLEACQAHLLQFGGHQFAVSVEHGAVHADNDYAVIERAPSIAPVAFIDAAHDRHGVNPGGFAQFVQVTFRDIDGVGQQPFGGARASGTNDKAGSMLNLLRWVSARSIKETFNPPLDYRYPFLGEDK